ncbi:HU family DNA-binding protein [Ferrovum myxofaciens]|uniref:DNA-binding protein HU n=2 Tax=root TaxID=1 RepID=A0A8F3DXM5_9PROT|nr:HU family DNA-binding protein [Ferrovum myxofaciens]KXW57404.1 DNA-binding protein HU [Ferrovum myxofaciens]MBU6995931.1 HU family DNA-binding protein [Ferrovum myxofaciens]QKE39353.1 MAG: HU family DNA-binding protein [Ferrovum myxofaciens]QKE41902.1 MAG: HU family DNA-binding protein [Ferrovum myxofaciens]QWY74621.1 MAG: HU family DNA-binding protein [Ferrovum myxofaciens]
MNKTELIDHIAKKAEITKADAGRALNATLETIIETLTKGEDVALPGFGSFRTTIRAAREGKNPRTGEKLAIPESSVPKFSAGASFKAAVAKK